jgi:hypothetical protein
MRGLWWTVPLLATIGSVAGAWLTFWMGHKIGERGLERFVSPKRSNGFSIGSTRAVRGARGPRSHSAAFPVHPVHPRRRALEVRGWTFFVTLTLCRVLRFGLEAALAAIRPPHRRVARLRSLPRHRLSLHRDRDGLTTLSIVRLVRSTRRPGKRRAAA